jgi:hypothetical protein
MNGAHAMSDDPADPAANDDTRTALAIRPAMEILDPIDPGDLPAIWKALAQAAIGGNVGAAEVARRWLRMRQRVLRLDLAPIDDATGVARAQAQLLALVAAGEITPREGRDLSVMVENRRKAIETLEFEPQLHALNEANAAAERQRGRPR